MIAFVALLGLEVGHLSKATARIHTEAVVAALVDFHKAQCYFSSTIQITILVLYQR